MAEDDPGQAPSGAGDPGQAPSGAGDPGQAPSGAGDPGTAQNGAGDPAEGGSSVHTLFTTDGLEERGRFAAWCGYIRERVGPIEQSHVAEGPFDGLIEGVDLGGTRITRVSESAVCTKVTPRTLRQRDEPGALFALIQVAGVSTTVQDGREAIQRAGDIVLLGGRPNVHLSGDHDQSLVIELRPDRLEGVLGSSRLYTALTMEADRPATSLATTFIHELIRVRGQLAPDLAARMASTAVDLLVAGMSDRLSREVPGSLHGTVVVQRAKAHIRAHLGDPDLDPAGVAAAVGVSLRRLQELFHEQGDPVSAWIWLRRLDAAARRLADPGLHHLPIGTLAYGCGFTSPAHFTRRFKDRYGLTPRAYREAARADAPVP